MNENKKSEPESECMSLCTEGDTYKRVTAQTVFGNKVIYATHRLLTQEGRTQMYYRVRKVKQNNTFLNERLQKV